MLAALLRVLVLATPVHAVYDTFGGVDCDAVSIQYDDSSDHLCVPKVAAKQVSKGYGSYHNPYHNSTVVPIILFLVIDCADVQLMLMELLLASLASKEL